MKRIIFILAALVAAVAPATAQSGNAVKGQIWTAQQQVTWGPVPSGTTLYILNTTFKRDSAGSVVALDTARYGSAGQGACSNTLTLQQAGGVQPEKLTLLQYRIRSNDTTAGTITMRPRWTDPVGVDTNWVDSSFVWDSTQVILTRHVKTAATTGSTQDVRFGLNATQVKVCITRVRVDSGDTLRFQTLWVRPF